MTRQQPPPSPIVSWRPLPSRKLPDGSVLILGHPISWDSDVALTLTNPKLIQDDKDTAVAKSRNTHVPVPTPTGSIPAAAQAPAKIPALGSISFAWLATGADWHDPPAGSRGPGYTVTGRCPASSVHCALYRSKSRPGSGVSPPARFCSSTSPGLR